MRRAVNVFAIGLLSLSRDYLGGALPCDFCVPGSSEALHTMEAVEKFMGSVGIWFLTPRSGSREV